jgi:ribosomal protein L11 methyltransferase
MPAWMELLAQVSEELAEEAAARLIEAGATAVETRDTQPGVCLLITHFLFEAGATQKLRTSEAALAEIGVSPGAIAVRNIEEVDWVTRSRESFTARAYGDRLWVRPPWDSPGAPENCEEIILEPSLAFGTGRHPSTTLCLKAIDRMCAAGSPERFLDIGCGSGILSVAALKLGAGRALALDLDPNAADTALKLAKENDLTGRMRILTGTLEPNTAGDWWGRVDMLAANIFLNPLRELAPAMFEVLAPGGRGVLSGIGYEQVDTLAEIAGAAGLIVSGRKYHHEWAAIEIEKP